MTNIARAFRKLTAQVQPYFEVLGPDLTVDFLLTFGGAEMTISENPQGRSELDRLVGYDKARALGQRLHLLQRREPLAEKWLARALLWQGPSTATIARRLRVSDTTVRKWRRAAGLQKGGLM